jgi:hypothetical protein
MSTPKKYQMPMRFRLFKLRRWIARVFADALRRILRRIDRYADFDPLVWAVADGGELRMTANPCTLEWELHIRVKSSDGFDTFDAYPINELDVVTSGFRMRDAIDRACLDHCMKHKILP